MTRIKLLHVSAPEFHPHGAFWKKLTQDQHVSSATDLSHCQYYNFRIFLLLQNTQC